MNWRKGERIEWKSDSGVVNFIDEEYITMTTREWDKCKLVIEHSRYPKHQVNVVIHNIYWKDVIRHE